MQSVMTHKFSQAPSIDAPRSRFNRSHGHKFTMDAGWLIPFYWDDVLPGDTFNYQLSAFARMSTPLFPILDNAFLDTHFFFVPYRILWDNSRKFFGEQKDPGDSIDYTIPVLTGATSSDADADLTTAAGRRAALLNYLGVPDGISPNDIEINALPLRAYMKIYDEWFRDQNLIDSSDVITTDGPDSIGTLEYQIKKRGKRHDYFTSALPWPQKGDAVDLPLGTTADVLGDTTAAMSVHLQGTSNNYLLASTGSTTNVDLSATAAGSANINIGKADGTGTQLYADLTNATAATINDLREAFQVQKLLERDARGGTRYSEIIKNHFGVDFYDVSYRPEYLGGGTSPVNINPIAQTAGTSDTSALGVGDLAAMGTVGVTGHGFTKSFVEHGIVMGIMSVRADLTYQQGLRREFRKSTRYDIYWPSLAHLGEQEILNSEIYCDGTANDDLVFGYQERYAEYRYKPSQISGLFQSAATGSLDSWHLSQEFASLPTLGQSFIEEDGGTNSVWDRVVQVSSEPHFIVDTYANLLCARPMPVFGVPGMIDHF
jgi:hypothetical protein